MRNKSMIRFAFPILLTAAFLVGGWALTAPQVEASRVYSCVLDSSGNQDDSICGGCPYDTYCAWVTCAGSTLSSCGHTGDFVCASTCTYLRCTYFCGLF